MKNILDRALVGAGELLTLQMKFGGITQTVYPKSENIFRAFNKCPFEKVKVVIIGQDPYHGEGQADGLCFSVNDNVKLPPSLKNIFKEIEYHCLFI